MLNALWIVACGAIMHGTSPSPIAGRIQQAIDDGRLGIFGAEAPSDGSWGSLLIGEITTEEESVTVTQAVFGVQGRYFYPASSIKLHAAIAAYEKINELNREGIEVDDQTHLRYYSAFDPEEPSAGVFDQPGEPASPITVRREVHKLFVVSDNHAFNRLFEFVGYAELDRRLQEWGVLSAGNLSPGARSRIVHRLSEARSPEENTRTPRIDLGLEDGAPSIPARDDAIISRPMTGLTHTKVGDGVLGGGRITPGPFDFTTKNYMSLDDLQLTLCRLVRPDVRSIGCCVSGGYFGSVKEGPMLGRPLDLTDDQRARLIRSATILPRGSESPTYDPEKYPDDYCKFLLPGLLKVRPLEEWRIVNKIGLAYGFVTENAYVEHLPSGNAVFVAAVIHRNPNGIYNDGIYEYETTLAEMATLGEVVGRALVGED